MLPSVPNRFNFATLDRGGANSVKFRIFIVGMLEYTDKVRPRLLRSGLSALGSGGRSFEDGSQKNKYIYIYIKKKEKKKKNRAVS